MFVEEATKLVFGRKNLNGRSVTGGPCWCFKGALANRALTPAKLAAVSSKCLLLTDVSYLARHSTLVTFKVAI